MSLTAPQEKAITALIEQKTLTAAAEAAGISRKTLYNYLTTDKEFAKAYKGAIEQIRLEAVERISAAKQRAIETIIDIMENESKPAIRLKAAECILKLAESSEKRTDEAINAKIQKDPFEDIFD